MSTSAPRHPAPVHAPGRPAANNGEGISALLAEAIAAQTAELRELIAAGEEAYREWLGAEDAKSRAGGHAVYVRLLDEEQEAERILAALHDERGRVP